VSVAKRSPLSAFVLKGRRLEVCGLRPEKEARCAFLAIAHSLQPAKRATLRILIMTTARDGLNLFTAIVSGASKSAASDASVQNVKRYEPPPTAKALQSAVEQLRSYMKSVDRAVEFKIDSTTGTTVVTVTDTDSGELIRQIPSPEVLWLAQHIDTKRSALLNTVA
jgi:flagellar protein FlaG